MFSSNQILEISSELSKKNIKRILKFIKKFFNEIPNAFQITSDNRFVLGIIHENKKGWTKFDEPCNFDIISNIIFEHLSKQELEELDEDGLCERGFKVKAVEESLASESDGLTSPFWGLVEFSNYTVFYSK